LQASEAGVPARYLKRVGKEKEKLSTLVLTKTFDFDHPTFQFAHPGFSDMDGQ